MDDHRREGLRRALIALRSRREFGRLGAALLGVGTTSLASDAETLARRRRKKKKKKSAANSCPGGCGFNERCVGNLCIPGCGTLTSPCGVHCCLNGVETCQNDQCAPLCADRRPPCQGVCCASGQTCLDDACGVPCPSGRETCEGACCEPGETCQSGQCELVCPEGNCPHFVFDRQWDGDETESGKFRGPNAIAIDADGNVYVIDPGSSRILKFTNDGQHVISWTASGYGLAVNNDLVYVANGSFVSLYTTDGDFVEHLSASGMSSAQDVTVDDDGNVYVITSAAAGRLFVIDAEGDPVRNWGGANGDFLFADGVAVDSVTGAVYVADTFHNRIQRFTTAGIFDDEWGTTGVERRRLNSPNGLAIDADGNIFVADYGNDQIKVFEYDTGFLTMFNAGGTTGPLNGPVGVALDSDANVFVADFLNKRVVRYAWTGRALGGGGRPDPERRRARRERG